MVFKQKKKQSTKKEHDFNKKIEQKDKHRS